VSTQTNGRSEIGERERRTVGRMGGESGLQRGRTLRGRPELRVSYTRDQAIFDTPFKKWAFVALLVLMVVLPFRLPTDWLQLFALSLAASIGAIGLNIISGYAGQISLGHAFFLGLGAYAGLVVGGEPRGQLVGFEVTNIIVLILVAGIFAGVIGAIVAPIATRVRGLYLAIVTLGLVFLGEHIFREADTITGGAGTGRRAPRPTLFGFEFYASGDVLGISLTRQQRMFFLTLVCLIIFGFLARNLARSDTGRAFTSVRDRDIAAEIMGVNLTYTKTLAFAISSFYAGVAGLLSAVIIGHTEPTSYNLLLSILYIAMILIGGIATISGSIMGAFFITLLPRTVQELAHVVPFITPQPVGSFPTVFHIERMMYGLAIILFVMFEPRGLYGIWLRVRNYFKAWPFSY
jgi:branched-chain amino acid transport system permease protein